MLGLHQTSSHRQVVEHAKPAAALGTGMVRAPSQAAGKPLAARRSGGSNGAPHAAHGPFGHLHRPGKAYFALNVMSQRALCHCTNVSRGVRQGQFARRRCRSLAPLQAGQCKHQGVAQQTVLGHGKAVPLGQRQNKVVGVEGLHVRLKATRHFRKSSLKRPQSLAIPIQAPILLVMLHCNMLYRPSGQFQRSPLNLNFWRFT